MQHFLSLTDWSSGELTHLLEQAVVLKQSHQTGGDAPVLRGKTLAMIFERPSLRTRVSFEMAMHQLGGHALYLKADEVGLAERESIADVARVLGYYVHAVLVRMNDYDALRQMAQFSTIPIINGLTRYNHPCQAMADALTLYEEFGRLQGLTVAYMGRSNQDVARSLLFAAAKFGFQLIISSPAGYTLDEESLDLARSIGGAKVVQRIDDPYAAVRSADAIYTDVWISTGTTEAIEAGYRAQVLAPYQVNPALLAYAPAHTVVLHCMPAHRQQEITDSVADGQQSRLFQQAENRLHVQKAILLRLLSGVS
jgi:ornithine carbamoyltransferase